MARKTANDIYDKMMDMSLDIAAVKGHLKNLNGNVARHEKVISETHPLEHKELDDRHTKLNNTIHIWMGGITVLMIVINIIVPVVLVKLIGG